MKKQTNKQKEEKQKKINEVSDNLINLFKEGMLPAMFAVTKTFPKNHESPFASWSIGNQLISISQLVRMPTDEGEYDFRTYKQWSEVGRQVKKGAKAKYIFAPLIINKKEKNEESGEEEVVATFLKGWKTIPVFWIGDTEGEPISKPREMCIKHIPLLQKAKEWGIKTFSAPFLGDHYGAFFPGVQKIKLCTPEEKVFFHELAHAAHEKVIDGGKLSTSKYSKQYAEQEVVAEFSALVLARIVGKEEAKEASSYSYISSYTKQLGENPIACIMRLADQVNKVVDLILE